MGLTVFYTRIGNSEHDFITICSDAHAAAHLAWITAHARSSKLNAGRQMPAFRMNDIRQRYAAADSCGFCTWYYLQNLKCCRRKIWKRLWYRNVFIAQLGKAMIGTDEEIVAADVVVVIVWRTVGRYGFGEITPM